jgi:hypothetical protein
MPEKQTLKRARKAKREGKAPTTQAGEFVREEVHHVREGKHGARSTKQAIAIGLSKARRAGVKLPAPSRASKRVKRQAARDSKRGAHPERPVSRRRSRATERALKRESHRTASRPALRSQAHRAAQRRTPAERSASARKASRTRQRRQRFWSQSVTEHSDAMTLEPRVFTRNDPKEVAASVKRSADKSKRLKSSPFRSAMSMISFYINRAGEKLSARRQRTLERAKAKLRELYRRR